MPAKYHIDVVPTPSRVPPVARVSVLESDGCLGCLECVKRSSCVYDVYGARRFDPLALLTAGDEGCVSCMRCVQECKKGILLRTENPRYAQLGDEYWTPALISSLWKQAATGKIPVSGAAYRGPFTGPGFDAMWTDMSEIVRPTRDGIHGREYISSVVRLGRRPERLRFDASGALQTDLPRSVELPLPLLLDLPDRGNVSPSGRRTVVLAAARLGTLAVATLEEALGPLADLHRHLVVRCDPARDDFAEVPGAAMLEIPDSPGAPDVAAELGGRGEDGPMVSVRLPLDELAAERVIALAEGGVGVVHLQADMHGQGLGARSGEFIVRIVRELHLALVERGLRDAVSLLLSGGVALAEHMAKIIICGVDAVGIDRAWLTAWDCRLCAACAEPDDCPARLGEVPEDWGVQRIVNLVGSWHSQLIEVMGAMGIREARRLRGEVGRAMFFDDLEEENFAPLFGSRTPAPEAVTVNVTVTGDAPSSTPQPSRFRNQLGRWRVVRTTACVACGKCEEVCAFDVHAKAGPRMLAPRSHRCVGPERCGGERGALCVEACPEHALRLGADPTWQTFGTRRWPAELIAATWVQAETGRPPEVGLEYRVGGSGGGFDRIELLLPERAPADAPSAIDLSIPLNRSGDGRPEVRIGFPVYGGGMSFGSISETTMVARARAYQALDSFTCTGEGGYPEALAPYGDHVITQVATGLFGVREETIQRARIVEFKYAQGAKPGLGGHLLGDKNTPVVAWMREAVPGTSLFSPFPFHSVYSVEDHKKHVDWIKQVNPDALVSVKVSTPTDVDMVAVGSYYAGAHIVHIDGSYGGTGAAPDIAKKNIAMPIEYAIPKVHRFLVEEGIRDRITLIASGGVRTAWDAAKAIALGADGVVVGTVELVALECILCGSCESGRGCPRGIATTDSELAAQLDEDWGARRLGNLWHSWRLQLEGILRRLGMRSVRELVGRSDLLRHLDYDRERGAEQAAGGAS